MDEMSQKAQKVCEYLCYLGIMADSLRNYIFDEYKLNIFSSPPECRNIIEHINHLLEDTLDLAGDVNEYLGKNIPVANPEPEAATV